jgi:hypothetical protein
MGVNSVKHSKFKNTGILFELLARQITADTLNGKDTSPAVDIVRKYFTPQTELGKELVLYRSLCESAKLSEPRALKYLDLVLKQRRKLDQKKLNEQKYYVIKEIKNSYPLKDFLSSKIPNYKLYASIYKTFLSEASPQKIDVSDIKDVAAARFTIVEHLMGKEPNGKGINKDSPLIEAYKAQQEDLRLLTFKILTERFNEKYKGLDEKQKILLREYINNISNTNSLREYINSEVPLVKKELEHLCSFVPNKITRIKLREVVGQMDNITKGKVVRDNQVAALMVAYQLVKELKQAVK